jgi:precorrin-6B methylase 2
VVIEDLDGVLLERLATESGLFHRDPDGEALSRALALEPLRALAAELRPGMRTLETGCGGTTVAFAAAGTRHTVVTLDDAEVERVRAFCVQHGISLESVDFVVGSSDRVLVDWSEPLDIVLVDGAHRVPFPFLDWHYTASHLKVGGRLFVDDIPIPAVHLLFDFLRGEDEWRLVAIHGDKLAVFEKAAVPPADPLLDWEAQRFNLPWIYDHVPLRRRWRKLRDRAMIGTRLRRAHRRSAST